MCERIKVISLWITSYSPCEQGSYPSCSQKFPLYGYLTYLPSASFWTPESCLYWNITYVPYTAKCLKGSIEWRNENPWKSL